MFGSTTSDLLKQSGAQRSSERWRRNLVSTVIT